MSPLFRGAAAVAFSIGCIMLVVAAVAYLFDEAIEPFAVPAAALLLIGFPAFIVRRSEDGTLSVRGGFVLVTGMWVLACLAGAVPFILAGVADNFADALFESASGFTTTGSSIFSSVEKLPRSILLWRSLAHWLGGMGIIVLAVAILPLLRVSGYQLMRAEAPGLDVERLTPRISRTAQALWMIYVGLTLIEVALLYSGGMPIFDAVNHSFATIATGGFSTRDLSIGSYATPFIQWVVTLFMVLSGVNFALYYQTAAGGFSRVKRDSEIKGYVGLYVVAVAVVVSSLIHSGTYASLGSALRFGAFQVATLFTSTGFATADYTLWPGLAQGVLLLMFFVAGCVGSTSGGIKMLHVVVVAKIIRRQFLRLIHPRGVFVVRVNERTVNDEAISAVIGFVMLYLAVVLVSTVYLMASGSDMETALTGSLAVIGNIGPGFGEVGPASNFGHLPAHAKLWLSFVMVMGRLEIFTVVVILTPGFSRRF